MQLKRPVQRLQLMGGGQHVLRRAGGAVRQLGVALRQLGDLLHIAGHLGAGGALLGGGGGNMRRHAGHFFAGALDGVQPGHAGV